MGIAFGYGWGSGQTGNPLRQFLEATGITDETQKQAVTDLYNSLKSAGLWSKMEAIYPIVGGTHESHRWNLKNVFKHTIEWGGTETHSAQGFIPYSAMPKFNINALDAAMGVEKSFHASMYSRNDLSFGDNFYDWGKYPAVPPMTGGEIRYTDNKTYFDMNGTRISRIISTATRLIVFNNLSGMSLYRDGVSLGSTASNPAIPDVYLRMNPYGMNLTRQYAFISFGQGLTGTEVESLNTIVNTYQTSLGRAV